MSNVKSLTSILKKRSHLLTIKVNSSFTETFRKIKKAKSADIIFVQKPKARQMAAVQLARLWGKKFIWVQAFSNPPTPSFITKFFLYQSDRIITNSKEDVKKLKNIGIPKSKINLVKK